MTRLSKGDEIEQRFVITELLGVGANSEVWKATDKGAKRDVAIKVMTEAGEDKKHRLLREAGKWADLEHENILRLYDVRSERVMLIMEWAGGGSLESVMKRAVLKAETLEPTVAWPISDATRIFTEILRGLAFAHERGILHGDLKPGNILLSRYGTAKISDFGMARELHAGVFALSSGLDTSGMSGTPEYMSPEQARGEELGQESDIFSVGIVAYQLFTGRHPFYHPSLVVGPREVIGNSGVICRDIRDVLPEMPERLACIVSKMLCKNKEDRYHCVRDILGELADEAATLACPECGAPNAVTNRYCGQCANPLSRVSEEEGAGEEASTAEVLVSKGFEEAKKGDWVTAIKSYKEAIERDASFSKAYANLGYALNHLGLYDEALRALEKGLELDEHPALRAYRAFSLKNLRRYDEALKDLDKALESRRHDTRLLAEKASCLLEQGDDVKAYSEVLLGQRYDPQNDRLASLRRKIEDANPDIIGIVHG